MTQMRSTHPRMRAVNGWVRVTYAARCNGAMQAAGEERAIRLCLHLTAPAWQHAPHAPQRLQCSPGAHSPSKLQTPVSLAGVCLFVCCRHMAEAAHAVSDQGGSGLPERLHCITLPSPVSPLTTPIGAPAAAPRAPHDAAHWQPFPASAGCGVTPEQSLEDAADQVTCTQKVLLRCATNTRALSRRMQALAADSECVSNAASPAVLGTPGTAAAPGATKPAKQAFAQALLDHWDSVDADLCAWVGVREYPSSNLVLLMAMRLCCTVCARDGCHCLCG